MQTTDTTIVPMPLRGGSRAHYAANPLRALMIAMALLFPIAILAQANYVYVNNQSAANSIAAYSVSPKGALTQLAASPFLTGGSGLSTTCYGIDRMVVSRANNLLFVSNGSDMTISTFSIDPTTGNLTLVGAPFATGLTLDNCQGISLAATPDGRFLIASSNGSINSYGISAAASLSLVSTMPNPFTPNVGMKISADGHLLAVSNASSVSMFIVNPDGSLNNVSGSPFPATGPGAVSGLEFSCAVDKLYAGEATSTPTATDAWAVAGNGSLTAMAGSPFSTNRGNSNVVVLSPDNQYLFESNQFSTSVTSFSLGATGALADLGGFGGVGFLHEPAGLATDFAGNYLYVADDTVGLAVMRINGDGTLANVVDSAFTIPGQIQGVAAYPPRSCTHADLALSQTASPSSVAGASNVTLTITITNNGPDPAAAKIVDKLPSGLTFVSCAASGTGVCGALGVPATTHAATFPLLASGESQTMTIVATADSTLLNGTSLTNTATISNKSAVDANGTNNSASATVTISGAVSATTLTPAPVSVSYGGSSLFTARLIKTSDGSSVAGRQVTFSLNGSSIGSTLTDVSGTATVSASLVGINAATYPTAITANFAGDPNFSASTGSSALTVTPAVLTVRPGNLSRFYGDPNPASLLSISGLVPGDTASALTGSAACTIPADATSPVGTYPVTCTIGTLATDANHLLNFVPGNGTLNISPAPLFVQGASTTRVYGDPNPPFTGSITGLKNGDNVTATFSTAATQASGIGVYAIVPTLADPGAKLGNYSVTIANGTLTITPAPLAVSADSLSRVYGDANPPLTGTVLGIKNTDNITATYSTAATAASPIGAYAIVPVLIDPTAKLGNYTVTIKNGTLTVTPATLTVNVNSASRVYGDANPVFTGTIAGLKNADNITATYSTTATPASAVGSYSITPTFIDPALKLGNYTVVINAGTLTITPATLTVSANSATRAYGNANPAFTGSILGIKNADAITLAFTTPATVTSNVGTYPIIPTLVDPAGKVGNYTVSSTNGTLTITTTSLMVTVANASRIYGNANPTFTATFTGLKNADPITATFSTVDPTANIGTYPITATLNDPAGKLQNYTVTINNGTLTITKAALSVTAFSGSRLYGDPNPSPTLTGLKNNDPIIATYSATSPTAASPIGTYTMVPLLLDPQNKLGNYTVASQNGTMTINQASLSVRIDNATRPYGSANPQFTGTITGIKNNDNITATFTTVAAQTSNVGSFAITATLSDPNSKLPNYKVTTTNGALTITAVPLTITANNQSMTLNGTTPAFTATYSGFVLNQTPANLAGTLSCSATNTIGSHPITCSGQSSNNYGITFLSGTLAVTYAPVGSCTNGPGHQVLPPLSTGGGTSFTKSTTPTIPVQFRVCDAKGTSISSAVVSSFTLLQTISGGNLTNVNQAQANAFTFNGTAQDWVDNLNTSNLAAGSTFVYQINLNDGTSISFQFGLQ